MRRWFLSYNSQDLALMQSLESALRRKDPDAKIFFANTSLRAGSYWLPELARQIAETTAFVLLIGERGLSRWQFMEYCEALDRRVQEPDFPVILVLLDGQTAPGLPFLRQLHWIPTPDPASEQSITRLLDAASGAGTRQAELWRYSVPYRGLAAMTEEDSDFFFGRASETVAVIDALEATPDRLCVLLGNSGVGKSSLSQAGVLACLARQHWPETIASGRAKPQSFHDSRRWCFLKLRPGREPLTALVEVFLRTWQLDPTSTLWAQRQSEWIAALLDGKLTLGDLLDATERQYEKLERPQPPAFLLSIDQGEELYIRAKDRQRRRFSEILAHGIGDPRLRAQMSLRSDFFGELQNDEPLYASHRQINVAPLRETQLREVVSRPAELLAARFESENLAFEIARRTAEESAKEVGALPLLSYLLDDMWRQMVQRGDGVLRLPPQSFDLGAVLVVRADAFLACHPQCEDQLRRIFIFRLASAREEGEPTRRRAPRSEFSDADWRLVTELADYPYRLLVTATPEVGETYAEVAHEAIFRRWDKLREWIAVEREFLIWKSGLQAHRRAWQAAPERSRSDALLMGFALAQAQGWLTTRAQDLPKVDREFIDDSLKREALDREQRERVRRRTRRTRALAGVLLVGSLAGLVYAGWRNQAYLQVRAVMLGEILWPKVLEPETERKLRPKQSFKECASCPEMVVVPAGEFMMGSSANEKGRHGNESPQHKVTIARTFAVSKFEVTFDEWDACVAVGGCDHVEDQGWGRGRMPVINVNWGEAQRYVAWLSKQTGKPYRMLSEAEWEYAARAGSEKVYPWGDEIGEGNANCDGCGSEWDDKQTAPVGSFAANTFGLHDMQGNVWEWVEDCYHENYQGAPQDGSAWTTDDCSRRAVRGGSWVDRPLDVGSASRLGFAASDRGIVFGLRVGRTLTP
jgi:formylglycine-generating enzyme required for sulfatase activity